MIFLFPRWDMLIPWRVYTRKKTVYMYQDVGTGPHVPFFFAMTYNYCHVFWRQVVFCWTPWVLVVWRRGFVPETYIFCGLWWFLLHSAIAFTMIFFFTGESVQWKKRSSHVFSVEGKHGCKITISNHWTAWGCVMNGSFQSTLVRSKRLNMEIRKFLTKIPQKTLGNKLGGWFFFDFSYEAIWRGWFFVQGGWRWIRNFPQGSLISSYHTEMELKKSKFPETSGIYDKIYGCLDIGFVVVWGRMDSKASTQNAIVENEDS